MSDSSDHFRREFRIAFRLWPEWARELYGPWVSEKLDDLEAAELFGSDKRASVAWLQTHLAAWRDGGLVHVPPVIARLSGEPAESWLDRMLSTWGAELPATKIQVWPPA